MSEQYVLAMGIDHLGLAESDIERSRRYFLQPPSSDQLRARRGSIRDVHGRSLVQCFVII
jgi:hypothetical protein